MQLCDALAVPLEDILIVKDEKQDDYCAQLELDFGGLAKKMHILTHHKLDPIDPLRC